MEALLQAHKDGKEGKTTAYTLVDELLRDLKAGNIDRMVYVTVDKGGRVKAGWSCNSLEAIGLLETGKSEITDFMKV